MILASPIITIPLSLDEDGTIRISRTRVTLNTIIARHQQGDSPEAIHEGFDFLPLNDIYAVISYYLGHREELDAYLQQQELESALIRQDLENQSASSHQAFDIKIRQLVEERRRKKGN